jgi:hypothetical protein
MKRVLGGLATLAVAGSLAWGQSLAEVARKEKERLERLKASGKKVRVITEAELSPAAAETATEEEGAIPSSPVWQAPGSGPGGATATPSPTPTPSAGGLHLPESEGRPPVTDIPAEGTAEEKLAAFQAVRDGYQQRANELDLEIAKKRERLAEVDLRLSQIGVGAGLPADPQWVDPSEAFKLQAEKTNLTQAIQEIEAKKQSLREELFEKARRAGIPPGYLR